MNKELFFLLVTIARQLFESIDDGELGWTCLEPIMLPLRGKNSAVKQQVYSGLTERQQSLFLFYAYYNHARNSLEEFYWWSAYYLAQPNFWSEIKSKLREFEDEAIVRLLEGTDDVLRKKNHPKHFDELDVSPDDLRNDVVLMESIRPLYMIFCEITPLTLKRFGIYIRNNPGEFVQMQD